MEQGHKRKQSLQDPAVDLGKMVAKKARLTSLKEELDGMTEIAGEVKNSKPLWNTSTL